MEGTLRLGRIAGIPIGIHYTWLFAFFLIAWTLAFGVFPDALPGEPVPTYWVMGAIAAIALFLSVLLHELAHSIVALGFGMSVQSITLFIFGGVSQIAGEAQRPRHEFLIAVVGPVTSLALAGIFWGLGEILQLPPSPVAAIVSYLGVINLLLGIFNLLPGFPLDGGRVLRSIVWGATGNLSKATFVATVAGQIFGWTLIGWGVFRILNADVLGGIWTSLIGWFLNNSAESARRAADLRERFEKVPIAPLIRPDPLAISPDLPVADLVYDFFVRRGLRALPVVAAGRLVGVVSITDVKEVPSERWTTTTVGKIMTRDPLVAVPSTADLVEVLHLIDERDVNQVLVVDDGRLVGLLGRADILRFMKLREELGPGSLTAPNQNVPPR